MQKGHILLIDDDEDEYMIFLMALQDLQVSNKCSYTKTMSQAFRLFRFALPDFIFLDINMPGVNGLRSLEEIKKLKAIETTPVFLYSNCISEAVTRPALSLGAAACIQKQKNVSALAKILREILTGGNDLKFIYPSEKSNERLSLFQHRPRPL